MTREMFGFRRSDHPKVVLVAAARPNFMKIGPVLRALEPHVAVELVHTGQHYDQTMSEQFFDDLVLPQPQVNLGVGSGRHGEQTAAVLSAFERYLVVDPPDAVVVVGDVNSTVACSLASVKLQIPVAHVEAGLRSRDWSMPEEINRLVTDRISRWLFTPSEDADRNLRAEGIPAEWIHRVGNVMIDTLLANLERARSRADGVRSRLGLRGRYGLLTLHRPSNVDEQHRLARLLGALGRIADEAQLVFPVHPRTRRQFESESWIPAGVQMIDPLGYLDFVSLMDGAELVLTDSGGIQEETSVLGVPCVTIRENTERPITCELGTNALAGTDPDQVVETALRSLDKNRTPAEIPLWDGRTAERIAQVLIADLRG